MLDNVRIFIIRIHSAAVDENGNVIYYTSDNKYTPSRTTPLSYSEWEYVEKLKSQLRNEAPIDKLMESLESKESQWGESDPLDMDENLVHEKTTFGKSDTISA